MTAAHATTETLRVFYQQTEESVQEYTTMLMKIIDFSSLILRSSFLKSKDWLAY
jgi:hypothetical protein